MDNSVISCEDNHFIKNSPHSKPEYGWRFQGRTVLLHEDKSLAWNDAVFEMAAILREISLDFSTLDNCLQCGICTSCCPNTLVSVNRKHSPRELIQLLRLGLLDLSGTELWSCTNCGACTEQCPSQLPLIDAIIGLRSVVFEQKAGFVPAAVKSAVASIKTFKNPWRQRTEKRGEWLGETGIQTTKDPADALLFSCCSTAYDPRNQNIAKAATQLMQRIGITFNILADKEVCCGDSVMRVGDATTFNKLARTNISNIALSGSKNVYTLSPHCFDTMKKSYFNDMEVTAHIKPFMLLLHKSMKNGTLRTTRRIKKKVTFHDPCFLAKHNEIHQEPRDILAGIEGLCLVEMKHNRKAGICCGGGGGGIWVDRDAGERLGEVRLEEALASKAELVVTACPFCLSMLEDAARSDPKYRHLEIMDICELVLSAL